MRPIARPVTLAPAVVAVALGLALLVTVAAEAHGGSVRGGQRPTDELAACVERLRASRPGRPDAARVALCVRPTRVETRSDVHWSTCAGGGAPAPKERCETGSARIGLRATRADREWRRGPLQVRLSVERWHLYGRGSVRCTRSIHGLREGDPRARRTVLGAIEHVDFLMLWPSISTPGDLSIGVPPVFSNWLHSTPPPDALPPSAAACLPVYALFPDLPPSADVAVDDLLDPSGVPVVAREPVSIAVSADAARYLTIVGRRLVGSATVRVTARFVVDP